MSPVPEPWLTVVGLHEDGLDGLGATARAAVARAETLVGDARLLALVPDDQRERLTWPKPLTALFPLLTRRRGRPVCVLASGDPLDHGIGALITSHFSAGDWRILPAPSSFSLACARLGWSRATVCTLSVHNRPINTLIREFFPGSRLLILTKDGTTPAAVAALLVERGYGDSRMIVLERMGGGHEGRHEGRAVSWSLARTDDLNVLAVECAASSAAVVPGCGSGLPDGLFVSDGVMTKRELRAVTLSALAPRPGLRLWDVGAGCGSITVEWLRATGARGRAVAIEAKAERRAMIAANGVRFGVDGLELVAGEAPAALAGLAPPDAVFVGGGLTVSGVFEACLEALVPGGWLVANAVSLEAQAALVGWYRQRGGELVQLGVARAAPLGALAGWLPQRPVVQWRVQI